METDQVKSSEACKPFKTFLKIVLCSQLSAVVDGVYSEHSNTAGTFTLLSSRRVFVGGSESTISLPGSRVHANFIGCLRKVREKIRRENVNLSLKNL